MIFHSEVECIGKKTSKEEKIQWAIIKLYVDDTEIMGKLNFLLEWRIIT